MSVNFKIERAVFNFNVIASAANLEGGSLKGYPRRIGAIHKIQIGFAFAGCHELCCCIEPPAKNDDDEVIPVPLGKLERAELKNTVPVTFLEKRSDASSTVTPMNMCRSLVWGLPKRSCLPLDCYRPMVTGRGDDEGSMPAIASRRCEVRAVDTSMSQ